LFSCLITLLISYLYKEILLFLIVIPIKTLNNNDLFYFIFTNIAEVFLVYIKLVSFLALQLTFLIFFYQCFVFLTPALFKKEYVFFSQFLKLFFFIWFLSLIFLNYYLVPVTWNFFKNFHEIVSNSFIFLHFEAKLSEYLDFYLYLYYMCTFYSQFFIALFFIFNYFSVTTKNIKTYRKLYYFVFCIFSTLISPPDVFSQISFSLLLFSIYEIIILCLIFKNTLTR
jgi:sec-independent protein translocase protein TatC